MQASTWKKKNFCSMYLPQFYLKPFFDPGERKKKQETFRQIGCVEKKRRKLCQFETALPKLYNQSIIVINTDYIIWQLLIVCNGTSKYSLKAKLYVYQLFSVDAIMYQNYNFV